MFMDAQNSLFCKIVDRRGAGNRQNLTIAYFQNLTIAYFHQTKSSVWAIFCSEPLTSSKGKHRVPCSSIQCIRLLSATDKYNSSCSSMSFQPQRRVIHPVLAWVQMGFQLIAQSPCLRPWLWSLGHRLAGCNLPGLLMLLPWMPYWRLGWKVVATGTCFRF